MSSSPLSSIAQCVILALLSTVLASYVKARSLDNAAAAAETENHADSKRFYVPVVISSDAILASLKGRHVAPPPELIKDNGLERKRTSAARREYLDSLFPRNVEPKRQMFWSPLGYMSASARRLTKNNPGSGNEAPASNREDSRSAGFRYG